MTSDNEIIWSGQGAGALLRVVRLKKGAPGPAGLVVELAEHDSQNVPAWFMTEAPKDRDAALAVALCAAHDELEQLRRQASAPEVPPPQAPDGCGIITGVEAHGGTCTAHVVFPSNVAQSLAALCSLKKRVRLDDDEPKRRKLGAAMGLTWKDAPTWDTLAEHASALRSEVVRMSATPSELHEGAPSRPEGEIPRGRAVVDAQGLASLRAELTALGKHVEDVERRAYASVDEHELVPIVERIGALEETTAGKAETLEALRSLTDALAELEQHTWRRTDDDTAFASPFGTIRACRHCGCLIVGGPTMCVGCVRAEDAREAVIREHAAGYREAPLDLATLRVPCATDANTDYAQLSTRGLLGIVDPSGLHQVKLTPDSARLLARALTQWADNAEKGAGK